MNREECGAGTPVRETPEARVTNGRAKAIVDAVVRSFALLIATLQEIFDESPYERFLQRSRLQSSVEAYATFLRENEQSRSRRPRCC